MQSDCRFNLKQRWSQFVFGWWHKSPWHGTDGHMFLRTFFIVHETEGVSRAVAKSIEWIDLFGMHVDFMTFEIILIFPQPAQNN